MGDRADAAEVTLALEREAEAGLLLLYSQKGFVGIVFTRDEVKTFLLRRRAGLARATRRTASVQSG